jgi:small subunit ribosomal protein S1
MSADKPEEDFASLFEAQAKGQKPERSRPLALGERCRAEVLQVGRDGLFVEVLDRAALGKRPQAFVHFEDARGADGQLGAKPGDVIDAVVVAIDARSGEVRLGRSMGRPAGLDELATAHAAGVAVEGKVSGVNKGGLEVEVAGVRGFCPISQADRGYLADPQTLIGRTLQFLVTELRDGGKRVVLSRRALLEQEAKAAASRTLAELAQGGVVQGTVTAVREFGAFVDLGGIEGLIPNTELSHDRGARANDVLSPGDRVEVQVREIKQGAVDKRGAPTTKITLSLKALAQDPWDRIESFAPEGQVVRGEVTRTADFGAFVRLAPGIEGLLHISELSGKVSHPSDVLKPGESLNVVVRSVDRGARRIALVPAPDGLEVGARAQAPATAVGALVSGTVDRVETFGVFLQIEGTRGRAGRGLIPNAELGTARGADTRKLFPIGTRLTAKVLETGEGKLRLSLRAVKDDEERADYDGYRASAAVPRKLGTLGDLLNKKK